MTDPSEFQLDVSGRLGKKLFTGYMKYCGTVQAYIEGVQERRTVRSVEELQAWLAEEYVLQLEHIKDGSYAYCRDKSIEEVFLEYALPRWKTHVIYDIGTLKAFETGDFSYLYRALELYVRYYYAGDIYLELCRNKGFAAGTGTDHGTYQDAVMACFALLRPDYAKRFYPKELGLVRRSHPTLNRLGSLVMGLLHDHEAWKEKALKDARKFLQGKRQISERAVISYMANLYDGNAEGMSADLQTLMDNYRRAGWLVLGEACTISLFGYYLMGKLYLDATTFKRVKRSQGPGWWDEYVDLVLAEPVSPKLKERFMLFTGPLNFLNKAVEAIDLEPPPGSVQISIDIKNAPAP